MNTQQETSVYNELIQELAKSRTNLLVGSIEYEQSKKITLDALYHLGRMLDERTGEFNRTGKFESIEHADDFIAAAQFMERFGRKGDPIEEVKQWKQSGYALNF